MTEPLRFTCTRQLLVLIWIFQHIRLWSLHSGSNGCPVLSAVPANSVFATPRVTNILRLDGSVAEHPHTAGRFGASAWAPQTTLEDTPPAHQCIAQKCNSDTVRCRATEWRHHPRCFAAPGLVQHPELASRWATARRKHERPTATSPCTARGKD